jgi:hypothetical protein
MCSCAGIMRSSGPPKVHNQGMSHGRQQVETRVIHNRYHKGMFLNFAHPRLPSSCTGYADADDHVNCLQRQMSLPLCSDKWLHFGALQLLYTLWNHHISSRSFSSQSCPCIDSDSIALSVVHSLTHPFIQSFIKSLIIFSHDLHPAVRCASLSSFICSTTIQPSIHALSSIASCFIHASFKFPCIRSLMHRSLCVSPEKGFMCCAGDQISVKAKTLQQGSQTPLQAVQRRQTPLAHIRVRHPL